MTTQNNTITGHREPTASEVKRGYGAVHYKDFNCEEWERYTTGDGKVFKCKDTALQYCNNAYNANGTILGIAKHYAKWIKCPYDGLRYYR